MRENGQLIKRFLKGLGSGIRFFKANKKKIHGDPELHVAQRARRRR